MDSLFAKSQSSVAPFGAVRSASGEPTFGSAEFVEHVYRTYAHIVFRRARQIVGTEEDAREIVQELFASFLERPSQFAGRCAISTWLYSATTHLALNRLRNARNRTRLLALRVAPTEQRVAEPNAEHSALARDVLAKLPTEEASAAIYYLFDGLTHDEISEVMGCSRRHVGNLLARARQRIDGDHARSDSTADENEERNR